MTCPLYYTVCPTQPDRARETTDCDQCTAYQSSTVSYQLANGARSRSVTSAYRSPPRLTFTFPHAYAVKEQEPCKINVWTTRGRSLVPCLPTIPRSMSSRTDLVPVTDHLRFLLANSMDRFMFRPKAHAALFLNWLGGE